MRKINLTFCKALKRLVFFVLLFHLAGNVDSQILSLRDFVIYAKTGVSQVGSSITINSGKIGSDNLVQSTGSAVFNTDIISGNRVDLTNSNTVTGRITAANSSAFGGNVLTVGSNATLSGNIDVNGNISVGGGIVSGIVTHPLGTVYSGPALGPGKEILGPPSLPVLPVFPAAAVFPPVGAGSITNNFTASPGVAYGDVVLGSNKTLKLDGPGVYNFKSFHFSGNSTKIVFDFNHTTTGNFIIYIHEDADMGKLNASSLNGGTTEQDASRIYFEVHGTGTTSSIPGYSVIVANGSSGGGAKSMGTYLAIGGGINIGSGTGSSQLTGTFYSTSDVIIQSGVTISYAPFGTCPTANAGPDQSFCGTSTNATLAANTPATGTTGSWSIFSGAGGSISDISSPTATFTPSGTGIYVLRWTISDPLCGPVYDDVTITFNQPPTTANAGPDQTDASTCDQTAVTLAANTPTVGSGQWTIVSGTGGSFGDANSPTSTFSGTAGSTYTLRWTISNPPCTASTDDVVITFNQSPMDVSAGPDKALNYLSEATLTGSTTTTGVTYHWYSDNGGVIKSSPDLSEIIVSTSGRYILTVTSTIGCTTNDTAEVTSRLTNVIGSELQAIYDNNDPSSPDVDNPYYTINAADEVLMDIVAKDGYYDYVLNLLQQTSPENYGLHNLWPNGESEFIITGYMPIPNVLKLNLLGDYISYAQPHHFTINNIGIVTTAGDTTMRTNLVRSGYDLDGTGIKIGVISNSFNTIPGGTTAALPLQPVTDPPNPIPQTFNTNTAAQDVSNGDLPGDPTNVDGYTTPVHVLQDFPIQSTDEGRAMLQTIHDVAPGAELYFRTGYYTAGDFAVGIKQLRDAGCKIIVDDLTYINEPFLKDGVVAKTVDTVVSEGVSYFSAAGNFSNRSYEKAFNPMDATSIGFAGKKAHNFGGGDAFQHVRLAPGNYTFVLQWVDNIYSAGETTGTQNDLDIYLTQNTDGTALVGYNRDNTSGDPIEYIPLTISGTDSVDYNVLIINNSLTDPARIKYVVFRGGIRFMEYNEGTSTLVGQANSAGAMAVGAARFNKTPPYVSPPEIEAFSSVGGTMTEGVVRDKPDFVGPDGGNTTVKMGQDYPNSALDGYSNFFGTSAAAPHAAAAAALVMQGKDKFLAQTVVPPAEIRSLFQSTAVDMETPGFDYISGHGLINVDMALRTFAAPRPHINQLVVPMTTPIIIPGQEEFTLTVIGYNFSENTKLVFGESDTLQTEYVSDTELRAIPMVTFDTDQGIRAYTPPYPTTNGLDGGFSNTLYFFQGEVVVQAVNITKQYGQSLPALDTIITINGTLLQDTTLTLSDIGLASLQVQTNATASSDVGTYVISVSRNFDETDPTDVHFLQTYNYKFINGTVTIEKLPLTITPEDITINYGEYPNIILNYDFDPTGVPDPQALTNQIRAIQQAYVPNNVLAVVNNFDQTQAGSDLTNLNMMATFNALKNSEQFQLSNGELVPVTESGSFDKYYLINVDAQSIYDYNTDPAIANLYSSGAGITQKGVIGSAALNATTPANISVNGSLLQMVNGSLLQMVNTTDGTKAPIYNGSLIQMVNGTLVQLVNGQLEPVPNASLIQFVNGSLIQFVNGQWQPIPDGSLVQFVNGSLLQFVNGSLLQFVNGDINGTQIPLINASDIEVNGSLIQFVNGTQIPEGSLIQLVNGSLIQYVNGSLLQFVNGSLIQFVNGSLIQFVNGSLLQFVNSSEVDVNSANNTAVIFDQNDAIPGTTNWLGGIFGVNAVTGLSVGVHEILSGTLPNQYNFDITVIPGTLTVNKATITVTAKDTSRLYGEANPKFTITYSGFKKGETLATSDITGSPDTSTTATLTSPVGAYPINVTQGSLSSSNYNFEFVNGTLTVNANACLLTHGEFKNFGNTPLQPVSLWLNVETKVSGQLANPGDFLIFKSGSVTLNKIASNPTITNMPVPDGKIVADNSVTQPITSYDAVAKMWITKVPPGFSSTSDIFVTGVIINSSNGFVKANGNTSSTLKGAFYSNVNFNDQWAYGIAAYSPQFSYSTIGGSGLVVSINGSYKAGTPLPVINSLVSGGSGGGGNNYTGSSSSFDNFTACASTSSGTNRSVVSPSLVVQDENNHLGIGEVKLMPNPATDHILLSVVPRNTGNSKIIISAFDGRKLMEIDNGVAKAGQQYTRRIDVSKLINGIYLVQVINGDAITARKIIISR